MPILNDESRYKILKLLAENPDLNQRQIASALGISLGKANYCVQALMEKGWIRFGELRRHNKGGYLLTLKGMDEKARVTLRFLQRKLQEHEQLKREIAELQAEVKAQQSGSSLNQTQTES